MHRALITIAAVVLLGGGLANFIWPNALESYIATRIDWRAAVAIPLARSIASIEILVAAGLLLLVRNPLAHMMGGLVFLAFLLVHTFEFVKYQPAGCPCAAGIGDTLPPRLLHLLLGVASAFMSVVLLSFVFRWFPTWGKDRLHVQS